MLAIENDGYIWLDGDEKTGVVKMKQADGTWQQVGNYFWYEGMSDMAEDVDRRAGKLNEARTYGEFYALSAVGGAVEASAGPLLGTRGPLFGTRQFGNRPLLNSNDTLRIGWSYIWKTGEYTFRIGGDLIEKIKTNPHINLWPPSWWFK